MSILIIDDEPFIIELLQEVLEMEGYQVYSAPNGQTGLDLIRQGLSPKLVLIDLMMPNLGGRLFVDILRNELQLSDIPVVLMTGDLPNATDLPPKNQFQDIFYKPFNIIEVVNKIKWIINLKTPIKSWAG